MRIVGEDEGRALNREYRQKDYATNVLTFDYVQEPGIEADLVLCAPVVEREAKAQKIDLAAHYAHLLVHGTLHAQGLRPRGRRARGRVHGGARDRGAGGAGVRGSVRVTRDARVLETP